MTQLILENISKNFDGKVILKDIDLTLSSGDMVALLGPSGEGKSTMLNIISGLLFPDEGKVYFDGKNMNNCKPENRKVGMVFQQYLLFPHMNVQQNIEFGLKMAKIPSKIRKEKSKIMIEMMRLEGLENQMPSQLSGGQQQRVAIGRTLIMEPHILLMDEPLANLDVRLRNEIRILIKELHQKIKITTLFVTHDRLEAFELADHVALLEGGGIRQIDTPEDIYHYPQNRTVAQFMGFDNFIAYEIKAINNNQYLLNTDLGEITMSDLPNLSQVGDKGDLAFRGYNVQTKAPAEDYCLLPLKVMDCNFKGQHYILSGHVYSTPLKVELSFLPKLVHGQVDLFISVSDLRLLSHN